MSDKTEVQLGELNTALEKLKEDARKFYDERSHKNAELGADSAKAVGQSMILINGGAATAILAFISKETGSRIVDAVPYSLILYSTGVSFGAALLYSLYLTNHHWNQYFQARGTFENDAIAALSEKKGHFWRRAAGWCFGVSVVCFLASSIYLAAVFLRR